MKDIKAISMAFLVGGLFAVVGQLLAMAVWQIPVFAGIEAVVVLFCMGLIGSVLFAIGLWEKISSIGGMGSALPLSGLAAAIANVTADVALETRSIGKGAFVATKEMTVKVLGVATVICMVIGAAVFFIDGGSFELGAQAAEYSAATDGSVPPVVPVYAAVSEGAVGPWLTNVLTTHNPALGFVNIFFAFLITGAICALCQLIIMKTKCSVPMLFITLITLGALLTVFGMMNPFLDYAGGGFQILVIDAGQAIIQLFCFALAGGTPGAAPFLLIIVLFLALTLLGVGAGAIRVKSIKNKEHAKPGSSQES